jgi:hypothetical protein
MALLRPSRTSLELTERDDAERHDVFVVLFPLVFN